MSVVYIIIVKIQVGGASAYSISGTVAPRHDLIAK